jgi:transposase
MAKHRSHSIEFKRQVAQEFIAGETLHGLAKRHDIVRNLIRIWVQMYEAGAFDEDATAADMIQEYEARTAARAPTPIKSAERRLRRSAQRLL